MQAEGISRKQQIFDFFRPFDFYQKVTFNKDASPRKGASFDYKKNGEYISQRAYVAATQGFSLYENANAGLHIMPNRNTVILGCILCIGVGVVASRILY